MREKSLPLNLYIVLALSVFILGLFLYLLLPFLLVLFWGGILAYFFYPLYQRINQILREKKALSAILTITIFIFFVLIPLSFLGILFYTQVGNLLENFNLNTLQNLFESLNKLKERLFFSKLYPYLRPYLDTLQNQLPQSVSKIAETLLQSLSSFVFGSFGFLIKVAFTIFTLYYFLVDGERIVLALRGLIPGEEETKDRILQKTSLILKGVLYGNVLTALVQGILSLIIYFLLDLPQYVFFAFLTMLASFIPFMGTALVWLPLSIYLFITGSYLKGSILIIFCALTVAQVDNLLKPLLIGGKTRIHNLLMFFAVLGGITRFGLTGLFLGPLILGLSLSILEIYKTKWLNHSEEINHPTP